MPPYSPDLNPIEPMWSKVNSILRSLAAHTVESLRQAIGVALIAATSFGLLGSATPDTSHTDSGNALSTKPI